ncbi:MAG: hypothetical protein DRP45_09285 [Candidatus Zixiibacteriota bacterium]|nr:MAG: hypothetical protein DRP45_09285 [candidate division Zixibacteria bacterium]
MKSLHTIADEINGAANAYRVGEFQAIRQKIHGLSRPKTRQIFTAQTTHDEWAFHSGGRKEVQFNIGFEGDANEYLRYGLAFSLEPSHTLPDPLTLKPKILKLNEYIRANASELDDLRFWYYFNHTRSPSFPATPVNEALIRVDTFLFWGKMSPRATIRPQEVLFLFDRLLPAYEYVEGDTPLQKRRVDLRKGLQFKAGCSDKAHAATLHSQAGTKSVKLHHNRLQAALYTILSQQYGDENVGTETDTGRGSRVDLVVRDGKQHVYYEIKTSPDIRVCLREAISQLLEYSYWPGGNEAATLVVVSENPMTRDARRYLATLRERFDIPVFYRHLNVTSGILGEQE